MGAATCLGLAIVGIRRARGSKWKRDVNDLGTRFFLPQYNLRDSYEVKVKTVFIRQFSTQA